MKISLGTLCLICNHMKASHVYSDPVSGLWEGRCWECQGKRYGFPPSYNIHCDKFKYNNLEYLEQFYERSNK